MNEKAAPVKAEGITGKTVYKPEENAENLSSSADERRHTQMFWLAIFGQVFAILAFAYSSCDTRSSRELDQRAWLVVKGLELTDLDHEKVIIQAKISNSGRTPAKKVQGFHSVEIVPQESCKPIELSGPMKDLGTIHPDADFQFPIRRALPWDAVDRVEKEMSHVVCVRGKISYDDVFERKHSAEFCYFRVGTYPHLAPCEGGNNSN